MEEPCYNPLQLATFGWLQKEEGFQTLALSTFGWVCMGDVLETLITNYCELAEDRLVEQFEDKPNLKKYLCVLISVLQELEFVFTELNTLRKLGTATGVQLDGLGDIVGVSRSGATDEVYRQLIAFQAGINTSSGEPESIIALAKTLTQSTNVKYTPSFPAGFTLTVDGPLVNTNTVRALEQSVPAGVQVTVTSSFLSGDVFTFAPDSGTVDLPNSAGFSEPTVVDSGGTLTEKFI